MHTTRHPSCPPCGSDGDRASDSDLLARVVGEEDSAAFALLVSRYATLVLGVCRRVLRDEHDAQDAFQATFLVLVRRAGQIRNHRALAGWLHAVARRTATRAQRQRRQHPRGPLPDDLAAQEDVFREICLRNEGQVLDDELHRLPSHYRDPLVRRYIQGRSNSEIALELGISLGVVEGRLKRGKDRLRLSLAKRGIGLGAVLVSVGAAENAAASAAESLIASTAKAAVAFRGGKMVKGCSSENAVRLAEKELAMSASGSITAATGAAIVLAGLAVAWAGPRESHSAMAPPPSLSTAASEAGPSEASLRANGPSAAMEMGAESYAGAGDEQTSPASANAFAATLNSPTQIEFLESPLSDVVDYIRDLHAIEIQIDRRALEDVGLTVDSPVTRNLRGVSLRTALRLILRDLDLTYTAMDDVLLITTPAVAEQMPVTRVYPVGDVLAATEAVNGDSEWLTDAVIHLRSEGEVRPEGLTLADVGGQTVLIVSETYTLHEDIERLLDALRQFSGSSAAALGKR